MATSRKKRRVDRSHKPRRPRPCALTGCSRMALPADDFCSRECRETMAARTMREALAFESSRPPAGFRFFPG